MPKYKGIWWVLVLVLCLTMCTESEAKRKRSSRRKRYTGPPPTHPVVLWSRTLSESNDREQRRIAAFKLSQYSQTIYQEPIVSNLIRCMKDSDQQIKVLCAKAMGKAGAKSQTENVRKALIERYQSDSDLRNTIVRTFIIRRDNSPAVHDLLMESLKKGKEEEELGTLLTYFELNGNGNDKFIEALVQLYQKNESIKVKRAVVKALAEKGQGQSTLVDVFAECSGDKDTPLALNCLAGLQQQSRKNPKAWDAVSKTVASDDPDMLMATLDVINALPDTAHPEIANRLVEVLDDMDDSEILEKAILAIGICGDHSEKIVAMLGKMLERKESDESVRIAAALVLGKQADAFPAKPKELLSKCKTESKTQALRTACQLGLQELDSRKAVATQSSSTSMATPTPSPTSSTRVPATRSDDPDEDAGEAPPGEVDRKAPEPDEPPPSGADRR